MKNLILKLKLEFFSRKSTHWLDALSDGSAGFTTLAQCMTVCDLKNDGYFKLIVGEIPLILDSKKPPRLRVYKGNQVVSEQGLPGIPSTVISFYIGENEPKMPSKCFKSH